MSSRIIHCIALVLSVGWISPSDAHEIPSRHLIVDTDMALDDARAVALLARAPGVELLAVLTSDGGSSPCEGASRVHGLLARLDRSGVPVGAGRPSGDADPPWRDAARILDELGSGEPPACDALPDAVTLAWSALEKEDEPVTWVALGPLTNLAALLRRHPESATRLLEVYYSGDLPESESPGWNTLRDPAALGTVLAGGVRVRLVHPRSMGTTFAFDADLLDGLAAVDSPGAEWITRLHRDPRVRRLVDEGHAGPWDDTLALALLDPGVFEIETLRDAPSLARLVPRSPDDLRHAYLRVLEAGDGLAPRPNVVLSRFPTEPGDLRDDVAAAAEEILRRHGAEEWKAALLANELHRHLGIYSLIGVKMGIRARELLDASLDELQVESRAGLRPPISCLNDGLQASTGASLGHGTIRVDGERPVPEAVFVRAGERLRLGLKSEIWERIRSDVAESIRRFGSLTPEYFEEIRRLSIRYWLELDRKDIFDHELERAETGS